MGGSRRIRSCQRPRCTVRAGVQLAVVPAEVRVRTKWLPPPANSSPEHSGAAPQRTNRWESVMLPTASDPRPNSGAENTARAQCTEAAGVPAELCRRRMMSPGCSAPDPLQHRGRSRAAGAGGPPALAPVLNARCSAILPSVSAAPPRSSAPPGP